MPKSVMDLQINPNQDTYVSLDSKELDYGSFVADIIVEKRGIEAPVYYGLNRVSLRYGAGVSIDENANAFGDNANTFIASYDETYFKSLKYVESVSSAKSTSSAWGITATVAVEVWMRPWVSVSGTRCTRCTPLSYLRRL